MPKIAYTDEFKRDAVALVASGIPQKQVAKDMGMAKTTLQAWVRDARFQSHGMTPTTDPEQRKDMAQALGRVAKAIGGWRRGRAQSGSSGRSCLSASRYRATA